MNEKAKQISDKVTAALHSSRGQNILLYLLFVAVAFVFGTIVQFIARLIFTFNFSAILKCRWRFRRFPTASP